MLLDVKLPDHHTLQTIAEKHPELTSSLEVELNIYTLLHRGKSIDEYRKIFQSMEKEMRWLPFPLSLVSPDCRIYPLLAGY